MATSVTSDRSSLVVVAEGIVAILFGLAVLVWQHLTIRMLLVLLGAYILVAGGLAIVGALRAADEHTSWWRPAVKGVAGILVAGLIFLAPGIAATLLLYLVVAWALVTGIPEVVDGLRHHESLVGASGAVLVFFAIFVLIFIGAGILGITWLIGLFAILYGALTVARVFLPRDAVA